MKYEVKKLENKTTPTTIRKTTNAIEDPVMLFFFLFGVTFSVFSFIMNLSFLIKRYHLNILIIFEKINIIENIFSLYQNPLDLQLFRYAKL